MDRRGVGWVVLIVLVVGALVGGLALPDRRQPTSAASPCPTPRSLRPGEEPTVRRTVEAIVGDQFSFFGGSVDGFSVALLPGREEIARALEQRLPGVLQISVGATRYCGGIQRSRVCETIPGSDRLPRGVDLELRLASETMDRSGALNGTLTVRNDGPDDFVMDPGQPVVGEIVARGTRRAVATYSGGIAGTGYLLDLAPGEEATVPVIVGMARCDGGRGSTLPSGAYGVRAGIGPNEGPATLLAPEVPLTITTDSYG